jgi:release factor glutamine methyltransferase
LELGTGSGAVIISIVLELLKQGIQINAHATDICPKALSVAQNNATWLGANVSFFQGSWFDIYRLQKKKFDLIVVNPPYIGLSHGKYISAVNLSFEPKLALYGLNPSADGMRDYKEILNGLRNNARNGSLLIMEHGSMQQNQIKNLLTLNGFKNFEEINDFCGLPRAVKVRL